MSKVVQFPRPAPHEPEPPPRDPYIELYVEAAQLEMDLARAEYSTNHLLHGVLTLFTFGLWLPMWLIAAAWNEHFRHKAYQRAKRHLGLRAERSLNTGLYLAALFIVLPLVLVVFSKVLS